MQLAVEVAPGGATEIVLESISVSFGPTEILSDVNATFRAGESVALVGPSGSGKSTLLSVIAGMSDPTDGRAYVRFDPLEREQPLVSWIFQTSPVLMRRTALDNAALGAVSQGLAIEEARARGTAALAAVGLGDRADERTHRLSGGERQRVVMARAIAAEADIVLADEPTASLDSINKSTVSDALSSMVAAGRVVLIATHDAAVAAQCTRVLEIRSGRLVSDSGEQR